MNTLKLGIDFGSSTTRVVYPGKDFIPVMFKYPNSTITEPLIPTEICYVPKRGGFSRFVGNDAFLHIYDPKAELKRDFKKNLILSDLDLNLPRWKSITKDFFEELLVDGKYPFRAGKGEIDKVLVSVPDAWYQDLQNPGLCRLLEVIEEAGIPRQNVDFQSDPVCAAAYYDYSCRQRSPLKYPYKLLVCDIGSHNIELTICEVDKNQIQVLHQESSQSSENDFGGVAFDKGCVETCLLDTLNHAVGEADLFPLLRAFEQEKIKSTPSDLLDLVNEEKALDEDFKGTTVYSIEPYEICTKHVWQAFKPIRDEIRHLVDKMKGVCGIKNWNIDQAFLVGGFSQYPLVEQTVTDCIPNMRAKDNFFGIVREERACATAIGAYYIINGMIQVESPYPYDVKIIVNGRIQGRLSPLDIPIINANKEFPSMAVHKILDKDTGEPFILQVKGIHNAPVPIKVFLNGQVLSDLPAKSVCQIWPPDGNYQIEYQIDRKKRAVVTLYDPVELKRFDYPIEDAK